MKELVIKYRDFLIIVGLLLLTLPVVIPFFHQGFFPTHDGEWTVVRLADMFRTVRDGQIPARYSEYLNMQYGYPLFNFAYPVPYYIGLIFVLLKTGFVSSIKILFVLSTVLSGIGMYLFASRLWKSTIAGLVSTILFLYLPYRMVDLYVRGSLGETVAFAIVPFMFWTMYLAIEKKSIFYSLLSGLLLGLLIPSHNIMSLLFAPIYLVFGVFLARTFGWNRLIFVGISFLLGILSSAFFWLPAIAEKHLILLATIPIADRSLYFVDIKQLLFPSWGYGIPTDAQNGFTYQLGIPHLLGFIVTIGAVILAFRSKKNKKEHYLVEAATLLLGMAMMGVIFMFSFTAPIWELLPLLSEINYPWTLIGPVGFLLSVSAGFWVSQKHLRVLAIGLPLLTIVLVVPYARPSGYVDRGEGFYITNMATTTSSKEYTPLWVKELPEQPPVQKIVVTEGDAVVQSVNSASNFVSFTIDAKSETVFRINTIYYPGWKLFVNGRESEIRYTNQLGVMEATVPIGTHVVEAKFTETPLRMTANIITLGSILVSVGYIIFLLIRKKL